MTEKLSQKNINLIFAVTENVVRLYQVTMPLGFLRVGVGLLRGTVCAGTGHGLEPGKTLLQPLPRLVSPFCALSAPVLT